MSYEFAGSLADEIIVAAIGTAPASVPAIMLIQASSGGPVNFTTGAVATGGIAGVSDVSWASYCQDMVRMQTSTPTNSPFYVSDVDFVGLPLAAENYIAIIWDDSSGPGDDIVAAISLRYQDSTWGLPENDIRTVVDAILVDTGTTLPASLSYAKDDVIDKRTWKFTKNSSSTRSPNIVTVNPNFDGTLKFDLANVLNKGAGVNAITSVTVSPSGPTITGPNGAADPAKTSDNQAVLFDVSGGQIDGVDHVFTCTVTTTDSDDALVVSGLLKYRST